MSAIEVPDQRSLTVRFPWVSVTGSLIAAVLFLGSAVLQLMASLQRWVVFRSSLTPEDLSAEDHLYDYAWPWAPWMPIGTAAELFGVGTLILALGVVVMAVGVVAMPAAAAHRSIAMIVVIAVVEIVLGILVAGSFGIQGAHALLSALNGTPSPLRNFWALGWIGLVGVIALGALWLTKSRASTVACVFLLGSTGLGHLLASFLIAPLIAGGISHDTTPWSETVVAASAAAAGAVMIFVAAAAARREAPPPAHARG